MTREDRVRQLAFYRSRTVNIAMILCGAFLTFALSPWSPTQWRSTPSLIWLHRVLPWPAISIAFLVYTVLLTWGTVRAAVTASFLGLALYGFEFLALIVTAHGHPINAFGFPVFFLVCVLHLAAGRLALFQREMP